MKLMTMTKIAIDTNILLYSIDTYDAKKNERSLELITESPYISSQTSVNLPTYVCGAGNFQRKKLEHW